MSCYSLLYSNFLLLLSLESQKGDNLPINIFKFLKRDSNFINIENTKTLNASNKLRSRVSFSDIFEHQIFDMRKIIANILITHTSFLIKSYVY
jgi:hypothetical protein